MKYELKMEDIDFEKVEVQDISLGRLYNLVGEYRGKRLMRTMLECRGDPSFVMGWAEHVLRIKLHQYFYGLLNGETNAS